MWWSVSCCVDCDVVTLAKAMVMVSGKEGKNSKRETTAFLGANLQMCRKRQCGVRSPYSGRRVTWLAR